MYYFAYGSNLSLDHMRRLCGWHCHFLGRAKLPEYEIGVDLRGYANIRPNPREYVFGVLYELDEEGLTLLDEFEGYPNIFGRQGVKVVDDLGVKYTAQVYIESPTEFGGKQVREEYFRRVVAAAHEARLPEEWIAKLEKLEKLPKI